MDYVRQIAASADTAKEIKIFGLDRFLRDRYLTLARRFYAQNRAVAQARAAWGALFAGLGTLGYYAAYVWIVAQTVTGHLSLGDLTFLAGSFQRLRTLMENLLTGFGQVAAQALTPRDTAIIELDRRAYLSGAALERIAGAEPTEAELRAAYDAAFGADKTPKEEYSASHILVKTEEEAKAIADELAKGADFGKLAEEKSTDNSGANKGDLGWFTPDMMVKPFADAVVALKKGEVSAPVQSQFGWHVIKLNDTRTQAAPEFDAIRDQLAMQVRRQKVEAEIQKQVTAARIEKVPGLDAGLLNKTDLLDK